MSRINFRRRRRRDDTIVRMNAGIISPSALILLAVLSIMPAHAAAQHMNAATAPCRDAAPNAEMTRCFMSEFQTADKELNAAYNQIRQVLGLPDQASFPTAQRLWVRFRNANCAAERDLYQGGSAGPTAYFACMEADARQRTAELKTMYGWILQ